MVDRVLLLTLLLGSVFAGQGACASDGEAPDSDFLEYLGSWEEGDEEWLTLAEWLNIPENASDAVKRQDEKDDDEQDG